MAESCKLEEVIIKAIPEIREKGHKKPTINTITKRLEQENCSYSEGEIKEAVERLIKADLHGTIFVTIVIKFRDDFPHEIHNDFVSDLH